MGNLKLIESTMLLMTRMMITTNMITRGSDGDEDGDVRQEVMQKDGQSESEREHDEGGGTTYQSGQSSGGSFFATAFLSAVRGATISKKYISQPVCFIQTKCCGVALDVIMFAPNQPNTGKESF